MSGLAESMKHDGRRIAQTPRAFRNWRALLLGMARQRAGNGPAELTFDTRSGLRISCPNVPGARVPVYEIFAEDCYHLDWFLGGLTHGPLQVLDIGAHVGTFACHLAHGWPQASIQSFEPSPTTAAYLRKNVEQNGLSGRIEVFERAVAGEPGFALLDDNGGGSGLNGLVSTGRGEVATATKVQTVTFDAVVAQAGSPVDVVKIDCEGGEYDLIYNSTPSSWASVRRVVIEYHDVGGQSWDELRGWFEGVGLRSVAHKPVTSRVGSAWLTRDPLPVPAF